MRRLRRQRRARTLRRAAALVGPAALLALAATSCGGGDSPSILDGRGPESSRVAGVWWLMFTLATVVYLVVGGLVVVAIVRGRRATTESSDGAEAEDGERGRGKGFDDDRFIWVGGIAVPVAILAVLAVLTVTTTRAVRRPQAGELRVEVVAKRWWWEVRYPDAGVTTANELRVPVGRQVDVALTSDNVLHSFWIPQLAGKVDTIPGQTNHLRFTADKAGSYRGECAEYCGLQHARMNFLVEADEPAEFDRWLARRTSGAGTAPASEVAARGEVVFMRETCAGCHAVRGTEARAVLGPDLSDFGSRKSIAAVTVDNNADNLARWIRDPDAVKPGSLMPPTDLPADELAALVAYLGSLK